MQRISEPIESRRGFARKHDSPNSNRKKQHSTHTNTINISRTSPNQHVKPSVSPASPWVNARPPPGRTVVRPGARVGRRWPRLWRGWGGRPCSPCDIASHPLKDAGVGGANTSKLAANKPNKRMVDARASPCLIFLKSSKTIKSQSIWDWNSYTHFPYENDPYM